MFNLNRRHTEALEKSARAEKRLADADETIAKHLGEFLRDTDIIADGKPEAHAKKAMPSKNKPQRR